MRIFAQKSTWRAHTRAQLKTFRAQNASPLPLCLFRAQNRQKESEKTSEIYSNMSTLLSISFFPSLLFLLVFNSLILCVLFYVLVCYSFFSQIFFSHRYLAPRSCVCEEKLSFFCPLPGRRSPTFADSMPLAFVPLIVNAATCWLYAKCQMPNA